MITHQISLTNNGTTTEITPLIGSYSWSDSVDELGQKFDFAIPSTVNTPYMPKIDIAEGNFVTMANNGIIVFMGVVVDIISTEKTKSVTCYDPLFYLNKSKTTIQFRGDKTATACIRELIAPFALPIGRIADMKTKIKKIYPDQTYSDILKDILNQAKKEIGEDYRFQMENGRLVIDRQNAFLLDVGVKLTGYNTEFDLSELISNPQRRTSIGELRNSVVITKDDQVYTNVANTESIKKYGLLQESVAFDGNTLADAKKQATSVLTELNRVYEEASFDWPGNDAIRSGRVLKVNEPKTGIIGQFIIKSTNHSVTNGIHKVNLTLKKY